MLDVKSAREIGIKACIDKLGRDFVQTYRESATSAYGDYEDGVFCFVGVDVNRRDLNTRERLVLDGAEKFQYRASCNVSYKDGIPKFIECVVPHK